MPQTDRVAVLATHLPATDRRVLSQAWYSALHLAEHAPPRARNAPARDATTPMQPRASCGMASANNGHEPGTALNARAGKAQPTTRSGGGTQFTTASSTSSAAALAAVRPADAAERRAPAGELARRIERALAQRPRGAAASFALSAGSGRMRILVRSDGARTRVVALCAPALRERVERALAQARFALAARGVRAEVA